VSAKKEKGRGVFCKQDATLSIRQEREGSTRRCDACREPELPPLGASTQSKKRRGEGKGRKLIRDKKKKEEEGKRERSGFAGRRRVLSLWMEGSGEGNFL